MKIIQIVLVSLLMVGCGKVRVDSQFSPYVDAFMSAKGDSTGVTQMRLATISIKFGEVEEKGALGQCHATPFTDPVITVDPDKWNELNDTERTILVFHELGHCELGRNHLEGKMDSITREYPCPKSIMAAIIPTGSCFTDNKDYYLNELFSND
jgi:hypothetical protein